jgi:hypothetical protein
MLKLLKMLVRENFLHCYHFATAFYCGLKRGIELTASLVKGRRLRDSKYSA